MRLSANGQELGPGDTILGPGDTQLAAPPSHIASQLVSFGNGPRPDINRMSSMPALGNGRVCGPHCIIMRGARNAHVNVILNARRLESITVWQMQHTLACSAYTPSFLASH